MIAGAVFVSVLVGCKAFKLSLIGTVGFNR